MGRKWNISLHIMKRMVRIMARQQPYNKIFDEEEYKKVNRENKDLLDDFIIECKATKKKPSTIA
jgi:hypothetical protein